MAPPENLFPVGELEKRVLFHQVDYKLKSRKLDPGFNLKDCELFELVQYTCTTPEQTRDAILKNPSGRAPMECWPFVRLFRRCATGKDDEVFHVETTAWEGQYAWKQTAKPETESQQTIADYYKNAFAEYGSYFWSKK